MIITITKFVLAEYSDEAEAPPANNIFDTFEEAAKHRSGEERIWRVEFDLPVVSARAGYV